MTPTQEDREAAARVWVQNLLRGDTCPDWFIYAFMRHRLAAEERGARMALEAAAKVAESKMQFDRWGSRAWWYGDGNSACIGIATAIRQIDLAALGAE